MPFVMNPFSFSLVFGQGDTQFLDTVYDVSLIADFKLSLNVRILSVLFADRRFFRPECSAATRQDLC